MITVRKYLVLLCSVCSGVLFFQVMYLIHLHSSGVETEKVQTEIWYKDYAIKVDNEQILNFGSSVDFTVNDILDNMKHRNYGDFVYNNFSSKLPSFMKNRTKLSFKADQLKVFVVPHSHNDPGYKKTFSAYFNESTSKILTLAVEKLFQYHDMTFVWPETCFIEKWWTNQTKTTRKKFEYLVKSGRLELTSGAWVIPDEATPHYFAYLDQMIEGHNWVKRHFGVSPEISFDMDQYSLSSTVRHMMREVGIKYSVVKRVHLGMKEYFMQEKLMNFYWKLPFENSLKEGMFVQVEPYEWLSFPDSCGPSRSICGDLDMGNDIELPVPGSPEADKPIRLLSHHYGSLGTFADKVVRQLKLKSSGYLHNVLLLPHGGDFTYDTANEWDQQYKNMKILMEYVNSNEKFNVRMDFGTLHDYFSEVEKVSKLQHFQYPVISGDFVPFALHLHYWSGFFTTRQYLKRLGRILQESVRSADILSAVTILTGKIYDMPSQSVTPILRRLVEARRELNIFQHHDAITGTSDVNVVKDYEKRLSSALSAARTVMASLVDLALRKIDVTKENKDVSSENISSYSQESAKASIVHLHDGNLGREVLEQSIPSLDKWTAIVLYNPFTQKRQEIIQVSSMDPNIVITDQNGKSVNFEYIEPAINAKLFFEATLAPLSISIFKVLKQKHFTLKRSMYFENVDKNSRGNFLCENSEVNVTFSAHNGAPIVMCYKKDKFCAPVNIHWRHYFTTGGAYTLSLSNESKSFSDGDLKIRRVTGKKICVVEVSHELFKVEYILKNITGINGRILQINVLSDLSQTKSKKFVGEFAMRIGTSINNGHSFYTDSNGFYLAKRKFRKALPFASNVYPVTSMAAIKDGSYVLTIHSVQTHGVVSWKPGYMDIMIDRVAIREEMGLDQKVTDNKPTLSKLFLHFEARKQSDDSNLEFMTPSSETVAISDVIQHPVESFLVARTVPLPNENTFHFLQEMIPCNIMIANMKCLVNDNFNIDGVSLTLHRRAMFGYGKKGSNCGTSSKYSVRPHQLFKNIQRNKWKIKQMSLSHLKSLRILTSGEEISFKELEMKTFLYYDSGREG